MVWMRKILCGVEMRAILQDGTMRKNLRDWVEILREHGKGMIRNFVGWQVARKILRDNVMRISLRDAI